MHVPDPNTIKVNVFEHPSLALVHSRDDVDARRLVFNRIDIVKRATEGGKCSVVLVMNAEDGSKYVVVMAGSTLNEVNEIVQSIDGP
jgi:hypothetical protein